MIEGKTKSFSLWFTFMPCDGKERGKPVEDVQDLLRKDPSLKPSQVQSALLVSTLHIIIIIIIK